MPQDGGKRGVDRFVLVDDRRRTLDIEPRKCVERMLEHRERVGGGASDIVVANARQLIAAARLRRLVRDLLDLVAAPFEIVDDLAHRQHHAQVHGGGLAPRDDLRALLIDVDLQLIDRRLVGADCVEQVGVLFLTERLDRARQLLFHHAAHRQDAGANAFHLDVELLIRVVLAHIQLSSRVKRGTCFFRHPKRPVM